MAMQAFAKKWVQLTAGAGTARVDVFFIVDRSWYADMGLRPPAADVSLRGLTTSLGPWGPSNNAGARLPIGGPPSRVPPRSVVQGHRGRNLCGAALHARWKSRGVPMVMVTAATVTTMMVMVMMLRMMMAEMTTMTMTTMLTMMVMTVMAMTMMAMMATTR